MTTTRMTTVGAIRAGAVSGFIFGVLYVTLETVSAHAFRRIPFGIVDNPFHQWWIKLSIVMVSASTLVAAMIGLAARRRLDRWPSLPTHGLMLALLASPLAAATAVKWNTYYFLGFVVYLVLAYGSTLLIARLLGRRPVWGVLLAVGFGGITLGSLAASLPATAAISGAKLKATHGRLNVLWFVFDTTRKDHLSLYGYRRETSPNLSRFAQNALVFDDATGVEAWTVPNHASMFTGLYPSQHGCHHGHEVLDGSMPTVAEVLSKAGYATAIFAGNPWLSSENGLSRGFARVVRSNVDTGLIRNSPFGWLFSGDTDDKGAKMSNAVLIPWLDEQAAADRPFFAFVNYMEPHFPYYIVPESDRRHFLASAVDDGEVLDASAKIGRWMLETPGSAEAVSPRDKRIEAALYDGAILSADRSFGEVIEHLRKTGGIDKTLVIVTADHGELLGEKERYGHERSLDPSLTDLPLVIRHPANATARRTPMPVQLVDLYPTVLEAAGLGASTPANCTGRSLASIVIGAPGGPQIEASRPMFAECFVAPSGVFPQRSPASDKDSKAPVLRSVRVGRYLLMRAAGLDRLYDLHVDPHLDKDIAAAFGQVAANLGTALDRFTQDVGSTPGAHHESGTVQMSAEEKAQLRALGYVQ